MDNNFEKNFLKTGTTTIGIVCKDGIVLAADKQGSYGDSQGGVHYIAGEMKKVRSFNDDIILTIAGTASLALKAISQIKAEIKLKELREKRKATLKEISSLFSLVALQMLQSGGVVSFIIAGKEKNKTHLYEVTPDGMLEEIDNYKLSGSGSSHINPIFDTEYTKDITLKQGIELAKRGIRGSSGRDPASGIGYEIWTITKDEIKQIENKVWKLD